MSTTKKEFKFDWNAALAGAATVLIFGSLFLWLIKPMDKEQEVGAAIEAVRDLPAVKKIYDSADKLGAFLQTLTKKQCWIVGDYAYAALSVKSKKSLICTITKEGKVNKQMVEGPVLK